VKLSGLTFVTVFLNFWETDKNKSFSPNYYLYFATQTFANVKNCSGDCGNYESTIQKVKFKARIT